MPKLTCSRRKRASCGCNSIFPCFLCPKCCQWGPYSKEKQALCVISKNDTQQVFRLCMSSKMVLVSVLNFTSSGPGLTFNRFEDVYMLWFKKLFVTSLKFSKSVKNFIFHCIIFNLSCLKIKGVGEGVG